MASNTDGTVKEPVNREPDTTDLISSFLTPSKSNGSSKSQLVAYDRNHGPIQHLSATKHTLTIQNDSSFAPKSNSVPSNLSTTLSISDLKTEFTQHSVTCALQCAGNRRHEMRDRLKEVSGIDWGDGAVMNAVWTGPLLRDVLQRVGVVVKAGETGTTGYDGVHVQFECNATKVQDDDWYGGSIPLGVAMDPKREVMLALKMNYSPLPPRHGHPLRTIIPGMIGARSVKWLDTITLSAQESQNFYQQHDYKILPPEATWPEKAESLGLWEKGRVPPMMDVKINSVVAVPGADEKEIRRDQDGMLTLKGYAIPGGADGPVVNVHVSLDKGETWHEARILDDGDENTTTTYSGVGAGDGKVRVEKGSLKFSWVLWEARVRADPAEDVSVWSKAVDAGGNTQEDLEGSWNLRGVGFNAVEGRRMIRIV
ncbi:hypothetical protein LTR84_012969 [Exophiala bonariae]|uniref:Sulfite oxidase n=1 Tax=Exophiala bonariae TaxID=1690606 RepID=A0AAV9NDQ9_9EURO|nr:hypothetical protein LTR84_012969 [Exophiala bonariae]